VRLPASILSASRDRPPPPPRAAPSRSRAPQASEARCQRQRLQRVESGQTRDSRRLGVTPSDLDPLDQSAQRLSGRLESRPAPRRDPRRPSPGPDQGAQSNCSHAAPCSTTSRPACRARFLGRDDRGLHLCASPATSSPTRHWWSRSSLQPSRPRKCPSFNSNEHLYRILCRSLASED